MYDKRGEVLSLEAQTGPLRTAGRYEVPSSSAFVAEASITIVFEKLVGLKPRGKSCEMTEHGAVGVHGAVLSHAPFPAMPAVTNLE